jgi:hypothetical protein
MKKSIIIFFISGLLSLISLNSFSQCAMCRRVAETGHNNDNSAARGLNKGILYLLAVPYVLGGVGAFVWYKNRKKE